MIWTMKIIKPENPSLQIAMKIYSPQTYEWRVLMNGQIQKYKRNIHELPDDFHHEQYEREESP